MRFAALCVILLGPGCAGQPGEVTDPAAPQGQETNPVATSLLNPPPAGFVDLSAAIPGIRLEIRYHGPDNFTGAPLTGYGAAGAWLREAPAAALARVQADLVARGQSLLIYDAYRPVRATLAMVAWAERSERVDVLDDGYVARRSGHNRGNTVDLTVVDAETGAPLDMGTPWDTFSTDSHTANAEGAAAENRAALVELMARYGWKNYEKEWWHYSFEMDPAPGPRDVPYGCFEPPEGQWAPPDGWNRPGFEMPDTWPADATCR